MMVVIEEIISVTQLYFSKFRAVRKHIFTQKDNSLRYVGCGVIAPPTKEPLAHRLAHLGDELKRVIAQFQPDSAGIEETFVSVNGASTLKLGQARGALLLTLAQAELPIGEYAARTIKQAVTGSGKADKNQVGMMVQTLLPQAREALADKRHDAVDALAIAICHAHYGTRG